MKEHQTNSTDHLYFYRTRWRVHGGSSRKVETRGLVFESSVVANVVVEAVVDVGVGVEERPRLQSVV